MKMRYFAMGAVGLTTVGLIGGLIGIGVQNNDRPRQIGQLQQELRSEIYPTIPSESRVLPKTGPSLPSPGYEN